MLYSGKQLDAAVAIADDLRRNRAAQPGNTGRALR
jgi:hypothetical protein